MKGLERRVIMHLVTVERAGAGVREPTKKQFQVYCCTAAVKQSKTRGISPQHTEDDGRPLCAQASAD